jgi:exo-1,4-beta-D-glucosaminidase
MRIIRPKHLKKSTGGKDMPTGFRFKVIALAVIVFLTAAVMGQIETGSKILLREKWSLQSSAKVSQTGEAISSATYRPQDWYPIQMPVTVVAALVANKAYPDPHCGMNLRTYPGVGYQIGQNFSNIPMPPDSPFAVSWWYRTEFSAPPAKPDQRYWLHFDGINFHGMLVAHLVSELDIRPRMDTEDIIERRFDQAFQ